VTIVKEPPSVLGGGIRLRQEISRARRRHVHLFIACAAVVLIGLLAWLWEDVTASPPVYVVGDSITYLSEATISSDFVHEGYQPTISATPGVKIGQSQAEITTLAQNQPWAWVIELGTNDAGANDTVWPEQFLAEWSAISPASCVVYVSVSPRAGAVAQQIDDAIQKLSVMHRNVHVLDWGNIEYQNAAWLNPDGIHPTPTGQAALAALETQQLHRFC
jgi:lysophospholipase L1-like esterase